MGWITFILAMALTIRILCWGVDAGSKPYSWTGTKRKYYSMVIGISVIFASAWGLVLNPSVEGMVLLAGVDLLLLANKRSPFRGGK